jgi:putative oxygen-independent coproporphyrinogen III oxidase
MIPIVPVGLASTARDAHLKPGAISLASLPPLSLYVHFPWCIAKCPYCDFNSHAAARASESHEAFPEARYINALLTDLELTLPLIWGRRIHTVFFGGGTPSLMSPDGLDALLSGIRARVNLEADAEITLEANPGSFEADKFHAFKTLGINRLSVGVQSFNPAHLKTLGRVHNAEEAKRALAHTAAVFDNFNIDLMFALPDQTETQALADLDAALEYAPPHLSYYHLTIEPNTLFAARPPRLPDEDAASGIEDALADRLASRGYQAYETSAWSRPQREARHNLNYWRFGDYIGIGAGAHGKISFAHRILRTTKLRTPQHYMDGCERGAPLAEEREVSRAQLPFEFMMNALRLRSGVPTSLFTERTGLPLSAASAGLNEATQRGLLDPDPTVLRATPLGQRFLNDLLQLFLP